MTAERYDRRKLKDAEQVWAARFEFLKDQGYVLRPRYRPGWIAPWEGKLNLLEEEEAILPLRDNCLDAQRISDGTPVWLKCAPADGPELEIGKYLMTPGITDDPRNHSVPLLDVLEPPGESGKVILVYPLLHRIDTPAMESVLEIVDFVQQTLEGLAFLHEHRIAHRDCNWENIMMDARRLYPSGWHAQDTHRYPGGEVMPRHVNEPSRSATGAVSYYFIDFDISTKDQDLTTGRPGQIRAPELSDTVPYDPYKLDVYILGTGYKRLILDRNAKLGFLEDLVRYMTPKEPAERPTAIQALQYFMRLHREMSPLELSRRLWGLTTFPPLSFFGPFFFWIRDTWIRQAAKPLPAL